MQLALMSYSFVNQLAQGTMTQGDTIAFAGHVGVGAIELIDDYAREEQQLEAITAALARTGVTIACYDVLGDFARADPAARAMSLENVHASFARAVRLGAPHILIIPGAPDPILSADTTRQYFADGLRSCLPAAQQLGLTVSIPNLGELAAFYGELAVVAGLLETVGEGLGVTFDVGNWLMAGEDMLTALDRLAPRIAHVHLKDWRIEPDRRQPDQGGFLGLDGQCYVGVALGEGVVDLPGALARLRQRGYRGYLAIEYEGSDDPTLHLRHGVAHARRLLATT